MTDWHYGVITTLIVLSLWSTWVSGNKIKLFQRGVIEPFTLAVLGGATISIYRAISGGWQVWDEVLAFFTGVALLVIIVKGKRGTLGAGREEDEED